MPRVSRKGAATRPDAAKPEDSKLEAVAEGEEKPEATAVATVAEPEPSHVAAKSEPPARSVDRADERENGDKPKPGVTAEGQRMSLVELQKQPMTDLTKLAKSFGIEGLGT